jgi:hypothetical protein
MGVHGNRQHTSASAGRMERSGAQSGMLTRPGGAEREALDGTSLPGGGFASWDVTIDRGGSAFALVRGGIAPTNGSTSGPNLPQSCDDPDVVAVWA